MNTTTKKHSARLVFYIAFFVIATFTATHFISAKVSASNSQIGAQQVTLNPGGGILANGSDGLRFTINADSGGTSYNSAVLGQDGVVYRTTNQYCCSAGAPMLNIGGTLYGQAGPAGGSTSWTTLGIIATSGSTSVGPRTSNTGSASATVRYTAVKSARTYTIDRTVSYTYPNDYVTDAYTFTIPSGNTETVKFYLGGDTAPGSSDQGYGIMLTSPVRSIISLNTSSQIMFGYREVSGSKVFDGGTSQSFNTPYSTVQSGGNIGFVVTASTHDAGLMMQWNLGSTPGTQTASLQQFATQQGTNLSAGYSASSGEVNNSVQLNISIVNTVLTSVSSLAYTFSLPNGLVVGSGSQTNGCSGTVTATAGSNSISLSGGSVGSATNCIVSVPVTSPTAATYTISSANATALTGLTNNVGTSALTLTTVEDGDGVSIEVESAAPNSGDANNDGTADALQPNVTSMLSPTSNNYIALQSTCTDNYNVQIGGESSTSPDGDYSYPAGLIGFVLRGCTVGGTATITQHYYGTYDLSKITLRKWQDNTYKTVPGAVFTSVTIGGQPAVKVVYQITDGSSLDDDGIADGNIVDPAGMAVLGATTTVGAPKTGLGKQSSGMSLLLLGSIMGLIAYTTNYRTKSTSKR